VREQLLRQFRRPRDRHRRGQRQLVEQRLDLLDLHLHAAMEPGLRDQVVVFGGQVDRIDHVARIVQQPARAGEEHDLVGLQHLHEFVGGEIGIDVHDLPADGFAEARDHGDRTGLQARLDRREIHALHLADQAIGFAIEEIGFEHARDDGRGACILRLQRFDELEVLRMEDAAHDRPALRAK
jgi:hypothetical protein